MRQLTIIKRDGTESCTCHLDRPSQIHLQKANDGIYFADSIVDGVARKNSWLINIYRGHGWATITEPQQTCILLYNGKVFHMWKPWELDQFYDMISTGWCRGW